MVSDAHGQNSSGRPHPEAAEEQLQTIRFLEARSAHGGNAVELIVTHISYIFLTGNRAYKLKRALRTNFLDFTTIANREAACRREIEVNAGVASGIYRRVVPVVRLGDGLALGGEGEIVDWVVEMNRFDRELEFDALAAAGHLDVGLVEELADCVAVMHDRAPLTPDFGGTKRVEATVEQIFEAIASSPSADDLADLLENWRDRAKAALSSNAALLDSRRRHGYVRRCHGDLHLGNICMFDGRPTPFDALEFNEEMASIDVLYDVAFIIMDMIERDLHPLANAFLNRYLSATRDYSGLALLTLFISMRSAVRALVAVFRPVANPLEPTAIERLVFAGDVLVSENAPTLIAIGGLSGTGKSSIARRIAPGMGVGAGAIILRSDVVRKRMAGVAPERRLSDASYRPEVTSKIYSRLEKDARRALASGSSVVLDATYFSQQNRARVEQLARSTGVVFVGIWLTCGPVELRRRILARGADASDASLDVLERQLKRDPGAGKWITVDTETRFEMAVEPVLRAIQNGVDRASHRVDARATGRDACTRVDCSQKESE